METSFKQFPAGAANLSDLSLWGVVGGNVFSIALALIQGWPLGEIMWVYWAQSIIIGAINFLRMWTLKDFSTDGFSSNGEPVPETEAGKRSTAIFFAFHFGFFHFVYCVFIWQLAPPSDIPADNRLFMMLAIAGFLAAHLFSFLYNSGRDFKQKKPNLGTLMFYPYMRIIPMHMTIIFGSMMGAAGLVLFMILKGFADAGMHAVEHHLFQTTGNANGANPEDAGTLSD